MSGKARWVIGAAAVCAVVVGAVVVWPEAEVDPRAYPGSSTRYTLDDAERLSRVPLPECARAQLRYYVFPLGPESVTLDFAAPSDCVDGFLSGFGVDRHVPTSVWEPRGDDPPPPIRPPGQVGARWEFTPGERVEEWTRVVPGAYREQVRIAVNRSAQPQRVYVVAFSLD
ncbi:hypothetical protein AB0425_12330 [Actinosynnema sp. NPDC051121]|nr:hypothetical protein [Saccharothrix sp.]